MTRQLSEQSWRNRCILASFLLLGLVLGSGCGEKNVTATGTVLQGKQPIALSATGIIAVTLVPQEEGEKYTTLPGRCDPTGKFVIEDVPPGKYKIAIEKNDPDPTADAFQGKYSAANTPFSFQIDGKAPIEIDLPAMNP